MDLRFGPSDDADCEKVDCYLEREAIPDEARDHAGEWMYITIEVAEESRQRRLIIQTVTYFSELPCSLECLSESKVVKLIPSICQHAPLSI